MQGRQKERASKGYRKKGIELIVQLGIGIIAFGAVAEVAIITAKIRAKFRQRSSRGWLLRLGFGLRRQFDLKCGVIGSSGMVNRGRNILK